MKRVVMTHPDVDGPRSFTAKNAEWLKSRDARWQEVPSILETLKATKANASNDTGIEKAIGGAEKQQGNKRSKKPGGVNKVSQPN